jgi:chemotaxis protein methyltransferase CheR
MMSEADLAVIQKFILQRTGILLTPEKRYLVETRLDPVMRQLQIPSLTAVAAKLRSGDKSLETAVVDAMTTNETLFFRDKLPFDLLRNVILPQLLAARKGAGRIRIWCAACSSGQEPYSIAMLLDEMQRELGGVTVEILATDISEKVLLQARDATYSQFEVQRGLPIRQLLKHFTQEGTRWRLNRSMADRVQFKSLNLLNPFRSLGAFDVILCRNVLIYFGEATRRDILQRLAEVTTPDGFLLLGGAETVLGLSSEFAPHRSERCLYVKAGSENAYTLSGFRPRLTA